MPRLPPNLLPAPTNLVGWWPADAGPDDIAGIHNGFLEGGAVLSPGENCDGNLGSCDPCREWRNHGEYIRCVSGEAESLVSTGALTREEGDVLVG